MRLLIVKQEYQAILLIKGYILDSLRLFLLFVLLKARPTPNANFYS